MWEWWRGVSIWTTNTAQIPMIVIGPYTCIGLRQKWQATIHVKYLPFRMTWQERKGWLYLVCICGTISRYIRYIIASFSMIHIYHFVFWVWCYGLCVYKTITHLCRTCVPGNIYGFEIGNLIASSPFKFVWLFNLFLLTAVMVRVRK